MGISTCLAGEKAKLGRVWPHMLRHSCGYYLADKGTDLRSMQAYLGHRDPKHTAHYTRVAGHRFEGLWRVVRARRRCCQTSSAVAQAALKPRFGEFHQLCRALRAPGATD